MRVTYTSVSSSDCAKGPLKAYKEVLKKSLAWEGGPTGPGALSWHTPWGSSPHSPFCSNCICQLLSGKDSRIMISGKWELLLFSLCVVSDGLRPHSLQCTRLPCPSPSPRVSSNSHPLSWWCHPNISSSVTPFSSYPQFFPAAGSFPMSELFTSGAQSIGAPSSASGKAVEIKQNGGFARLPVFQQKYQT